MSRESINILGFKILLGASVFILNSIGWGSKALPNCSSRSQNQYKQFQMLAQEVKYIAAQKPTCVDNFVKSMQEKAASEPDMARYYKFWARAAQLGETNVRELHCPDGELKASFLDPKVFTTNAHAFYDLIPRS